MAPDPQCAALAAAKEKKGLSYGQIATELGASEDHVIAICTSETKPTKQEFDKLAQILGITASPAHAANVVQ